MINRNTQSQSIDQFTFQAKNTAAMKLVIALRLTYTALLIICTRTSSTDNKKFIEFYFTVK